MIDIEWDIPRLKAWNRRMGGLPPLAIMVGKFLGYELKEEQTKQMTMEEHAARLVGALTGGGG